MRRVTSRGVKRCAIPLTVATILGMFMMTGCAAPNVEVRAEEAVSRAAGVGVLVESRGEPAPLDEPFTGERLGESEAVQRAVLTDAGLQALLARVRVAMAEADQARLIPNPVVNLVLRWGGGGTQVEASLAADLLRVFQTPRRASAADHRLRRAAGDAVTAAIDVVCETRERYAGAWAASETAGLVRARVETAERLVEVVRARAEAGEGTADELAAVEAMLTEERVELLRAERSEREERLRLARVIGEPSSGAGWVLGPWGSAGETLASEASWVSAALRDRPELRAHEWEIRALEEEAALSGWAAWEGAGAGVEAERDGAWAAGPSVSVPVPVFDTGGVVRAKVTAARAAARHELLEMQRRVVEEVRTAHAALVSASGALARVREDLLPRRRAMRAMAETAYLVGEGDVRSVLLAEHGLRVADTRAVELEKEAWTARVRLERAAGGPGAAEGVAEGAGASAWNQRDAARVDDSTR